MYIFIGASGHVQCATSNIVRFICHVSFQFNFSSNLVFNSPKIINFIVFTLVSF